MIRPMGEFTVSQRTKDSYFDGGDLLRQWNSVKGNEQRKMDEFLLAKRTGDFIEALIAEERENGLGENSPKIDNQVVKKSKVKEKGKAGRPKEEVWFANRNEPKQKYIDAGYFEMKEKPIPRDNHPGFVVMVVLCTQKGLAYINHLFGGKPSDGKLMKIA